MDANFILIVAAMYVFGDVNSECRDPQCFVKSVVKEINLNKSKIRETEKPDVYVLPLYEDIDSGRKFDFEEILKEHEIKLKPERRVMSNSTFMARIYDLTRVLEDLIFNNYNDVINANQNTTSLQIDDNNATKKSEDALKHSDNALKKSNDAVKKNDNVVKKGNNTIKKDDFKSNIKEKVIATKKDHSYTDKLLLDINDLKSIDYSYQDDEPHKTITDLVMNFTDYPNIDYIEIYKDTTNDYVPLVDDFLLNYDNFNIELKKKSVIESPNLSCHSNDAKPVEAVVYPWIATIFAKNSTHNQFVYVCDGALVSDEAVITAGNCLALGNGTRNASDLIVVMGKKSLQSSDPNEAFYRIKDVIVHEQFTTEGSNITNDIAVLLTETSVKLNDYINTACILDKEEMDNQTVIAAMTTGWKVTGELTNIPFVSANGTECEDTNGDDTSICNSYDNDIIFCPSHGGVYLVKLSNNKWYLHGIRSSDTSVKTICVNWNLKYTQLFKFEQWLNKYS